MSKESLKRYFVSGLVTFFSGVALVLAGEIDNITLESFRDGSVVGVLFVAVRTGVKFVLELFLSNVKK